MARELSVESTIHLVTAMYSSSELVRQCFRILSAKNIGLTTTLVDTTKEEFRVLELIEG